MATRHGRQKKKKEGQNMEEGVSHNSMLMKKKIDEKKKKHKTIEVSVLIKHVKNNQTVRNQGRFTSGQKKTHSHTSPGKKFFCYIFWFGDSVKGKGGPRTSTALLC